MCCAHTHTRIKSCCCLPAAPRRLLTAPVRPSTTNAEASWSLLVQLLPLLLLRQQSRQLLLTRLWHQVPGFHQTLQLHQGSLIQQQQ